MTRRLTRDEFIAHARAKHGEKYDYSKVEYVNSQTKVCIICRKHGAFMQKANNHLQGKGCIKCRDEALNRPIFGVGINDSKQGYDRKARMLWFGMMKRCYSNKYTTDNPTYKECKVCEEWLMYSNFEKWYLSQTNHNKNGYDLDKDLLSGGSKIYSPETCCLLPKTINVKISHQQHGRSGLPCGVYMRNIGSYYITYKGKKSFDAIEDAHNEYLYRKKKDITDLANEFFKDGRIEYKIYEALINFKIT